MTPRDRIAPHASSAGGRARSASRALAAALLLATIAGPAAFVAAAGEAATMEARVLLQGHARVGSWMAIEVHLQNDGPAIEGEIRLAGGSQGRTRYGIAVDLATQSAKTYVLYAQPPAFGRDITVELVASGARVASSEVAFLAHDASQLIVGVVAERPGDIVAQVDLPPSTNGSPAVIVSIAPGDLPDRAEGWSTLDGLIWQDIDSNRLSVEQLAAMRSWLAGGGRLIVAGGSAGIGTLSSFPDDILPFRPTSTVDVPRDRLVGLFPSLASDAPDLPALSGTLSRGRSLAAVGDRTIAAEAAYGSGSVTLLGVDPTAPAIAATGDVTGLWRRSLPPRSGGATISGDDSQLVQALQQLPALALPPIGGLLVLLGAYILLVGPLNYLVLRRLDRREWAWVTMPALIGIFAVAAYGYGAALRGLDVIINEVSIIRGAPDTTDAMAQVYLGVFSPSRRTYQLEVPGGALLSSPFAGDIFGTDTTLDILQGDPARVRDLSVPFGSLRSIRAESPTPAPRIGATLDLVDGVLVGSVVNRSEVTLEKVAVVLGSSAALLGDLGPGATGDVSLKLTNDPFGRSLAEKILGQAFFDRPEGPSDADARLLARTSILNQLTFDPSFGYTGRLAAETPVILAWGTADVLDVRVEGQVPRRVANSLIYVPVPMSVTGTTTFTGDLIRNTVVESDAMFFSKDPTWLNLGTGSATIAYRTVAFDGSLDVSGLRLAMSMGEALLMDGGKPVAPLPVIPDVCTDITNTLPEGCVPRVQDGLPEVELFDRAGEGTWVRLPHLAAGTVYAVEAPGRYVDATSGAVLVRFVNEQPDGGFGFQFSVAITGTVR